MVYKSALGHRLQKMSYREAVLDHILPFCQAAQCDLVARRNKGFGSYLYTIDVETATSLDIGYCHRHIISGMYLYES